VRSAKYKAFFDRQAKKLPDAWCRHIFFELCVCGDSSALARRLGMAKPLVDAAFRVHAERLVLEFSLTDYDLTRSPRGAAKYYGLTVAEFLYLRRRTRMGRVIEPLVITDEDAAELWRGPDLDIDLLPIAA
jgi:hypothetical protein